MDGQGLESAARAGQHGRKRICLITQGLVDHSGGAERVFMNVAAALAAEGHEVEILTHERRAGRPFYPIPEGVTFTPLCPPPHERSLPRRAVDWGRRQADRFVYERKLYTVPPLGRLTWEHRFGGFRKRLERHLNRTRPDIAVAFMPTSMIALAFARVPETTRKVGCTHNVPEINFGKEHGHNVNPVYHARNLAALERLDRITVLLESHRDWYPEHLRERVFVLPNAVRPCPEARPADARAPVLLAVGRLSPVKRLDLLVEAWARIADRHPGWRVEICGAGDAETLQAAIDHHGLGESVRLLGAVHDMPERYGAASALVHPAAYEGFPMAVCEALACRLPVIGFADCPGVNALVQDDVNGVLVPAGEDRVAAFARAMEALIEDPGRRARLAEAAPATMAPFAPDSVQRQWHRILFE